MRSSVAAALLVLLAGCATERLPGERAQLAQCGFRAITPRTDAERQLAEIMEPYRLQQTTLDGRSVYAYNDVSAGVLYVGGSNEYYRYQSLELQQRATTAQSESNRLNQRTTDRWQASRGNYPYPRPAPGVIYR